jgi:hypothetical protein
VRAWHACCTLHNPKQLHSAASCCSVVTGSTRAGLPAQVVQQASRERAALQAAAQEKVSEAEQESEALRKMVKLKTHELRRVRRLAQEVLLQRSDVETFLVASLHKVKSEMTKSEVLNSDMSWTAKGSAGGGLAPVVAGPRRPGSASEGAEGQQGGSGAGPVPVARTAGGASSSGAGVGAEAGGSVQRGGDAGSRRSSVSSLGSTQQQRGQLTQELSAAASVDISDLGWGDCERVLRLLFSKINNQARQQQYSNLPGHSLGQSAAA